MHRYLGLVIGVQFLLWTIGGLYFSWTSLDAVHGDHLIGAPALLPANAEIGSPATAIAAIRAREPVDSLLSVELLTVLDRRVYRIGYVAKAAGTSVRRYQLADVATGELLPPLGRETGEEVARRAVAAAGLQSRVRSVELVTEANVGGHHEYRGQPLPAWAVSFDHPEAVTAYVPTTLGRVVRVRNDRWRTFDFLWMLHTMDYQGRDNINNIVLRAFSVLGLATVMSGFVLFASTSRPVRRMLAGARTRDRSQTAAPRG